MERKISLSIAPATEKTCGNGTGVFCPHVLTTRMGGDWFCGVFQKALKDQNGNVTGWLQRLPECLAAQKPTEDELTDEEARPAQELPKTTGLSLTNLTKLLYLLDAIDQRPEHYRTFVGLITSPGEQLFRVLLYLHNQPDAESVREASRRLRAALR